MDAACFLFAPGSSLPLVAATATITGNAER